VNHRHANVTEIHDDSTAIGQWRNTCHKSRIKIRPQNQGISTVDRLAHPAANLVTSAVVEPQDSVPIR
jgi:hypothetical protein